jgi:hypothetical protein
MNTKIREKTQAHGKNTNTGKRNGKDKLTILTKCLFEI